MQQVAQDASRLRLEWQDAPVTTQLELSVPERESPKAHVVRFGWPG
jgi:hypothetical protein